MTAEDRIEQAQELTGQHVARHSADIRRMIELGVMIDVDFHGEAMFSGRATWAEVGVPRGDVRQERLSPGVKYYLPKSHIRKIRSLATRVRQSVDDAAFNLESFKPWRWMPYTGWQTFIDRWDELQVEIDATRSEIIAHRDEFIDVVAQEWATIAEEAWDAIKARRADANGDFAVITATAAFDNRAEFVDYIVGQAVRRFPSVEDIQNGFYASFRTAILLTGADIAEEEARQEQAKTTGLQEYQQRQQMTADATHQEQVRRETLFAVRQAELEHQREVLAQTISPLQEVFEQFRAMMYKDIQAVSASIRKNGYLRGKVAQRARRLLETYNRLGAATGDLELKEALKILQDRLNQQPADPKAGKYDTNAIQAQLDEIAEMTHSEAMAVSARAGRRTRAMAIEL